MLYLKAKYISSNGKEYDLIGAKIRVSQGSFHSYEWKEDAKETENGSKVYGFTKEPKTFTLVFTLRGELEERYAMLDDMTNSFEHDVVNLIPGRFWYGNYYIDGYVKKSSVSVSSTFNNWTELEVDVYCPYSFWINEQERSFYPEKRNPGEQYNFLEYPFDYSYDYSRQKKGSQNWVINHFAKCNFKMIIYGPCTNPRILINDHIYQVFDTLEGPEYIVVDSKNKTIMKYLSNGTIQNIFYKREKESSIFEPLPPGELLINWNAEFGFDIIAYRERSVPEWISSEQT